jgi:ribosomal protein L11
MAKKITGYIKLQVPAGEAKPARRSALRWVSAA